MKKSLFILLLITITMGLLLIPGIVSAQNKVIINVLTQPRREWELLEQYLPEFEEKENIDVVFHYFAELERRSKSRLDASTKAGQYQVYYIDEANVAEFAVNNWLIPIKDYYPEEYDFADFSEPLVAVLTFNDITYGAPMTFEGNVMFYRKDLFERDG
ncbi:MAG TPA: extracellular solute-binding protein, partial [Atribacter sp.]